MGRPKVEVIPAKKPKLSAQTAAPVTQRPTAAYVVKKIAFQPSRSWRLR
jgi:hypothetical protein